MADNEEQRITELPVKTSSGIAATDYLLGIDSNEGYQTLIKDLGDYIIQNVSSSLAGSNQTLAAAISALNSKAITALGASFTDFNTLTTPGMYFCSDMANSSNYPTGQNLPNSAGEVMVILRANNSRVFQILYMYCPNDPRVRVFIRSMTGASTWSDWMRFTLQ